MSDDLLIKAGKLIIGSFFKRSEKYAIDDAELLPLVKDVVNGISKNSTEVEIVRQTLFKFAQNKYVDLCKKHQEADGDHEDQQQENEEYFEYVYKNEEHPD